MRIGLTGGGASTQKIVEQAVRAEQRGFSSLWYASSVLGDPLAALAVAGRATTSIELGTAVLQTYPCHPLLQANRAAAVAEAMGRPGFTLGIGPSHETLVRGVYGLSYENAGASTEEYVRIVAALLRGEVVDFDGEHWSAHSADRMAPVGAPVPVLLSAMSPRMLRVCGQFADGAVLWMATARAIETLIAPRLHAAAAEAGRSAPRIIAGLPVAVHDDVSEARAAAAAMATSYAGLTNYQRVLEAGGVGSPAEAALVGDEESVRAHLNGLLDAGATDVWAQIVPVGDSRDERIASLRRTTDLLAGLVG
jgi:F420-dependent oxidoreductase-like protein